MTAEWRKVPGKRVKGYTKKDGTRVKGYVRKRAAPKVKGIPAPATTVSELIVSRLAVGIYRPKGDKDYLGETSRAVLENVHEELARTLGAKRIDIDSVWRCDFRLPPMSVAKLISLLVEVNDVDLAGGKVGVGAYLRIKGREILIPFAKARYSLTETCIEGAETLIKQILKYLPELGATEEDDEGENPIDVFARRSAASRKGAETKRKRCKHRRKTDNKRCVRVREHKGKHKYKVKDER